MIDVVIPLYNGSSWIEETLASVFRQSVRPSRVIVVDDGSTDDSLKKIAGFDSVEVVANTGKGPNVARNTGFAMSNAPYIAFLDQDDVWHENHLQYLMSAYKAYPDAGLVLSRSKIFWDGKTADFDLSDCSYGTVDAWDAYPQHVFADTPGVFLFRREILAAEGGWPEAHCGSTDYSIALFLSINRPLIQFMGKTLARRRHGESRSKTMCRRGQKDWLHHYTVVNADLMQAFASRSMDKTAVEKIRRRHDMFISVKDMVEAFSRRSLPEFNKSRRQLEQLLRNEPERVQKRFIGRFWGLLKRHLKYKGTCSPAGFFVLKTVRTLEQITAPWIVCRFLLATRALKLVLAE